MSKEDLKTYTAEEVAEMLHTTPRTVWGYIRKGKLKGHKVGRAWQVFEKDLKSFIEKC